MNDSNNPSAVRSRKQITDALLLLMEKYPYEEISVKQIVLETDLVRKTFYRGNERQDLRLPKYEVVSTHTGRKSFICNALALGIPVDVVMKWTGHADYKSMKPYIAVADEIKAREMAKFNASDIRI